MNNKIKTSAWVAVTVLMTAVIPVNAASLEELLEQVRQGRAQDAEENAERIRKFEAEQERRQELLAAARTEQELEEQRSSTLENSFENNERRIAEAREIFLERLGELKELYGILQQAADDASVQFRNSITNIQFPGRTELLDDFSQRMERETRPPSLADMEKLWFELQREMIESGRVARISTMVSDAAGGVSERQVVRVGPFNLVSGGKYLEYVPETGRVVEPPRQPGGHFQSLAARLEQAQDGLVPFGLDPSRGRLLSLLIQKPGWQEQVEDGGIVGYLILALGALALLIAFERLLSLSFIKVQVKRQMHQLGTPGNNPLGRVLKIYYANPNVDQETLELRLAEVIFKERANLLKRLAFLKIIAVVAPLMGLLGTVTGMIITFQAIALFGTGDPKLMAGGISQALVTTVMGLCVAIPIVLLHALATGLAQRLAQLMEEQATGIIAEQAEKNQDKLATPRQTETRMKAQATQAKASSADKS